MSAIILTSYNFGKDYSGLLRRFARDFAEAWEMPMALAGDEFRAHSTNHGRWKGWASFVTGINQQTGNQRYAMLILPDELSVFEEYLDDDDPAEFPERGQRWEDGRFVASKGNGEIVEAALAMGREVIVMGFNQPNRVVTGAEFVDIPVEGRRPWRKYLLDVEEL